MKIDLNQINKEFFNVKEGLVGSETCFLVTPKQLNAPWTQENKFFRSSIWNKNGEPVSFSFPKFVNFNEKPDVFPVPNSLKTATVVTKIDGSALIVSKYKGQIIHRTRGTFDASLLESGHEIELLKNKYPEVFNVSKSQTWGVSYIYEWVSPLTRIVLDYKELELYLVGAVCHNDYSLYSQSHLDEIAQYFKVKRPESHTFTDIQDMLDTVKRWEGKEGICLYSNNGQSIHKIKADLYLKLHIFKSNATLENTIDLFIEYGYPTYNEFEKRLIVAFDEDCAKLVLEFCEKIVSAHQEIKKMELTAKVFVDGLAGLSRKVQAENILLYYGPLGLSSYAFCTLDKRAWDGKMIKKLLLEKLK